MPRLLTRATALLLAATPVLALAHAGHDAGGHHGFAAGLEHPFTGLDHLMAMLAVGLWGALTAAPGDRGALLRAPLAFAGMLLIGALAASAGLALPAVESMIAASLLALGLLLALRLSLPAAVGVALVGGFAVFHGAAHGQELSGWQALAGMLLGTVLLHALGLALGRLLRDRSVWWTRLAGAAAAGVGVAALIG